MRTRIVAVTLCLLMMSAVAAASAASAATVPGTPAGQSDVYKYDLTRVTDDGKAFVVGTLSVNIKTGHWEFSFNIPNPKYPPQDKAFWKELAGQTLSIGLASVDAHAAGDRYSIPVGKVTVTNGGTVNAQGYVAAEYMDWLAKWGPGASFTG